MSGFAGKKILVTGGAGFLGGPLIRILVERGARPEDVTVPAFPRFDLRRPADCADVVAGKDIVIHLAANAGGIGWNRAHPGRSLLRQRRDGDPPDGGVPQGRREKIRPDRHRLRLPVPAAAHPVPRGRPLGRVSGADQRAVRHRQEGDDGDGAGVPGGVRLQRDLPAPREPVRPPRPFLRAGEVPRHPRLDPEVRRRPRIRRARGRGVGKRLLPGHPRLPRVPLRGRRRRRRSHWPPSGTTSRPP